MSNSRMVRFTNPKKALEEMNSNCTLQKVTFDYDKKPSLCAPGLSHVQGYARYRGNDYDFHIFSHSDLHGSQGYLYIASEEQKNGKSKYSFTLKVPAKQIRHKDVATNASSTYNPHFNHPCGLQIVGDYLLVPVIPFHSANSKFYDSAVVYLYDLTSLKGVTPKPPSPVIPKEPPLTKFKEVMLKVSKVSGGSLSCAGITDLKDGRFAIGLVADNNLDVYFTSNAPSDLSDAVWETSPVRKYSLKAGSGKNHYQGAGFLLDENEDVYMIGFDTRGGSSKDDMADMYKLTYNNKWLDNQQLKPIYEKHLIGTGGARFTYAGGIEVRNFQDGKTVELIAIYSTEANYTSGGIRINYWAYGGWSYVVSPYENTGKGNRYCINMNPNRPKKGVLHREMHKDTCGHLPKSYNRFWLGIYLSPQEAIHAAREHLESAVDGCYYCCNEIDTM